MKFWIDENVPKRLSKALTQAGHEAIRTPRGYSDPTVLRLALEASAIVVTRDQDFERLVLTEKWPCAGIIWLRSTSEQRLEELIAKLVHLVKTRQETLLTSFVTLSLDQIKIINLV